MKFLIVGDFHGKVPNFLGSVIKKNKFDAIISTGDYCSFVERKLFFKYSYQTRKPLADFIGLEKVKRYGEINLKNGEKVLKYLNGFNLPIISVMGNMEEGKYLDVGWKAYSYTNYIGYKFDNLSKKYKNFKDISYKSKEYLGFNFVGYPASTYPGWFKNDENKLRRKDYLVHEKKLVKLFRNKKNVIFLSHNVPYNTKLDVITDVNAPSSVRGKHYGSVLVRRMIERFKPKLCIGGHMHENPGKDKIKNTLIINPGACLDKRYAILDIDKKINLKLF